MSKPNFIAKFFKNINLFINKLLERNLNKLNSKNLLSIIKNFRVFDYEMGFGEKIIFYIF